MTTISELEEHRKNITGLVEARDRLLRLTENADFRYIVREQFFVEDCARYARESVDPALNAEQRASALAMAQSAGYFKQWLNMQLALGNQAEAKIQEIDEAIEEERLAEQEADGDVEEGEVN